MSRKAGTIKTGGRKAGTPNKVTGALREFVVSLLEENREQVLLDMASVSPKDRLMIFERLLGYVIPKRVENEWQLSDGGQNKIEIGFIKCGVEPVSSEDEINI